MSVTPQQVVAQSLTVLNAVLTPTVYDQDKVPSPLPGEYAAVMLARVFGGQRKSDGRIAKAGYRLIFDAASNTSVANVRKSLDDAKTSLEFKRLTVSGVTSTPIQFDTENVATTKDGWARGRQIFTFVI